MNSIIKQTLAALIFIFADTSAITAKDYDIIVTSNPDNATVYLNGTLVSQTTPAVIKVDKKTASKMMIFSFRKNGYESSSVAITYTKYQLKHNPTVYCDLKRSFSAANQTTKGDPTVTVTESRQHVDRHNPGVTSMEKSIIRWYFDSDSRGARIFWRVISSVPAEVKNTNETYLTTTPLEETRGFDIQGLTYNNSRDVTIEIKVSKRGYEDQVKRFNVRQALDQQEISGFFELVKKDIPAQPE